MAIISKLYEELSQFNSRSITQNGIFVYVTEREYDTTDYYELLGIDGKTSKSEASRVIRMYNLYKNKMCRV